MKKILTIILLFLLCLPGPAQSKKDLQATIVRLENQIALLENQVKSLVSSVGTQKAIIDSQTALLEKVSSSVEENEKQIAALRDSVYRLKATWHSTQLNTPATIETPGIYAVDLGLSVKWASCNLGASKPEDSGEYFAWGETEPKNDYNSSTYKWGSYNTITKYNTDSSYGTVDNKTVLDPEDDVAHVKLGSMWRMPTDDEWTELTTKCKWTWITYKGVKGYKVTSPNGNSIFLPAAGFRYDKTLNNGNDSSLSVGHYWSSSLNAYLGPGADGPEFAFGVILWPDIDIPPHSPLCSNSDRHCGYSVRPVYEE